MKTLIKSAALALIVLVSAFTLGVMTRPASVSAQDEEQPASEETAPPSESTYEYTAQPGDSYTKIARKAVQTFGAIKQVNLTQAQIVAAETYLTQAAGSPHLSVGDKVSIKESEVEAAVKKAQGLTEAQLALWQNYVTGVNFDTNKVGQAS